MNRRHLLLLLGVALVMFVPPMFTKDLWTPDEPRYAEIAREMVISGDYLVPRTNEKVYTEKPPLLFWLMAASAAPFGEMNEIAVRMPSLLSALLVLFLTYALATRLYSPRMGLWSALVLMTALRFWNQAHTGQIDMLLAACMMTSLYAFRRHDESHDHRWLFLFYGGIAAGLYAKGPPALLFPMALAFAFYWRDPEGRRRLRLYVGLPIAIAAVLLWLVPARGAVQGGASDEATAGIVANLYHQIVGRIFLGVSHAQPPWYYVENLLVDWFPWSLFAPWIVLYTWRERHQGRAMRLLLAWTIPALVFLTLSTGKRALYLLPLYPAFAMLTAGSLLALVEERRERWLLATGSVWSVVVVLIAPLPALLRFTPYASLWGPELLLLPAWAACSLAWTLYALRSGNRKGLPMAMITQTVALLVVASVTVVPAVDSTKSAKAFVHPIRLVADAGAAQIYSAGFIREEYVFYANAFFEPVLQHPGLDVLERKGVVEPALMNGRIRSALRASRAEYSLEQNGSYTDPAHAVSLDALYDTISETGLPKPIADAYLDSIESEAREIETGLRSDSPVFFLVQETDWRWMQSFFPESAEWRLLEDGHVGSRRVLLFANASAVQRLNDLGAAEERD